MWHVRDIRVSSYVSLEDGLQAKKRKDDPQ